MAETRRTRGTNDDKFVRLYWVALHYRVPYFVRPSNTLKLFTRRRMLAFHLGPCRAEHSTNAECKTFIRTNSGFAVALNHLNAITLNVSRTKEKENMSMCVHDVLSGEHLCMEHEIEGDERNNKSDHITNTANTIFVDWICGL